MDKTIKVTFDFTLGKIVVEGEEGDLLKLAQEVKGLAPALSEIRIITQPIKTTEEVSSISATPHSPVTHTKTSNMRDFARSLPLSNVYEKIAGLAYYAIKIQGKPHFSCGEISDWFGLCGFPRPAKMPVALSDTRRYKEYVINKGRDQWTITTAGENLIIEMLERQKK